MRSIAATDAPGVALPAVQVYPSAAVLPENLLRLHLFFEEPPHVDRLMQAVRLLDHQGQEVAHPFLDLNEGLWDSTGTRLTLLLHPGRIKSGLAARLALGPAVQAGQSYRLQLDLGFLSGQADASRHMQAIAFNVDTAFDTAVEVAAWRSSKPMAGTLEPLRLTFDRPMDRLGLEHAFSLYTKDASSLPFTLCIGAEETSVLLTPLQAWAPGWHRLACSAELEDVAGNRVAAKFEQAINSTANQPLTSTSLEFETRTLNDEPARPHRRPAPPAPPAELARRLRAGRPGPPRSSCAIIQRRCASKSSGVRRSA